MSSEVFAPRDDAPPFPAHVYSCGIVVSCFRQEMANGRKALHRRGQCWTYSTGAAAMSRIAQTDAAVISVIVWLIERRTSLKFAQSSMAGAGS